MSKKVLQILFLLCSCSSSSAFSSFGRASVARNFDAYATSDGNDVVDETQQKGMEEAFASLDGLSPSDFDDEQMTSTKDEGFKSDLKYSRTDDTGASDTGKATEEEVEHYLEMTTELDGTACQSMEENVEEDIIISDEIESSADDVGEEDTNNSEMNENLPWESINPILRLRGQVATGYGRGGKKLGVPTANLPASLFQSALEDVSTGVYFGWAVIEGEEQGPIKAVVNVGYSPTFEGKENKEKIVEAHLITKSSPMADIDDASITENILDQDEGESDIIDEINDDFYGETMRLQLIGFLRPEQKFDSFPDLIAQIHRDIGVANVALQSMPFIFSKEDAFIQDVAEWIGSDGGDNDASWEFETW